MAGLSPAVLRGHRRASHPLRPPGPRARRPSANPPGPAPIRRAFGGLRVPRRRLRPRTVPHREPASPSRVDDRRARVGLLGVPLFASEGAPEAGPARKIGPPLQRRCEPEAARGSAARPSPGNPPDTVVLRASERRDSSGVSATEPTTRRSPMRRAPIAPTAARDETTDRSGPKPTPDPARTTASVAWPCVLARSARAGRAAERRHGFSYLRGPRPSSTKATVRGRPRPCDPRLYRRSLRAQSVARWCRDRRIGGARPRRALPARAAGAARPTRTPNAGAAKRLRTAKIRAPPTPAARPPSRPEPAAGAAEAVSLPSAPCAERQPLDARGIGHRTRAVRVRTRRPAGSGTEPRSRRTVEELAAHQRTRPSEQRQAGRGPIAALPGRPADPRPAGLFRPRTDAPRSRRESARTDPSQATAASSGRRERISGAPSVTIAVRPSVIARPFSESARIMCRKRTMPGSRSTGLPS